MATRKSKRWSKQVTEKSNALDLEEGVFSKNDPRSIARSLKRTEGATARCLCNAQKVGRVGQKSRRSWSRFIQRPQDARELSNYLHPTDEGRIGSMHALDNVDGILTARGSVASVGSVGSVENVEKRAGKPLQNE